MVRKETLLEFLGREPSVLVLVVAVEDVANVRLVVLRLCRQGLDHVLYRQLIRLLGHKGGILIKLGKEVLLEDPSSLAWVEVIVYIIKLLDSQLRQEVLDHLLELLAGQLLSATIRLRIAVKVE